jgi:hypothetical protein
MMTLKVGLKNMGTVDKNLVTLSNNGKEVDIYFSYSTPVAVDNIVSVNEWSKTTGKLLNELQPNKEARVPHEIVQLEMERKLKDLMKVV